MSPIKGISEIVRLPRLGKIRLGIKKERDDGSPYPVPTDHFVCPDEVKEIFGDKPKELRIMFPTENSEQWASQYLRCYSTSNELICRGDGETALARIDKTNSNAGLKEIICSPNTCSYHQSDRCRRVMNLQFLLPDCPGFGVYQLDTTSFHSMKNINSALAFIRGICQRVSMIPLSLELVEQEVQPEGWLKTAYVLRLTCPYPLAEVQRYALVPPGRALLLPPPDSEAPDDLFPKEVTETEEITENKDDSDKLINLWTRAKSKIWHMDIRDYQIVNWFEKNYRITVRLIDFESVTPPLKLTAEILSHFCRAVERYANG
ncbi:hypothetical protein ACFLY3_00505 [Chloroflexota bacterium]